jgi:hypothetical protein
MSNYALISDKNIVSDSDNEFELEEQYKELTSEEYKKLYEGGRAVLVKIISIDDR